MATPVKLSREEKRRLAAADTRPRRTISFYRYVKVDDPEGFKNRLLEAWSAMDCLGRIYVAKEGINAQMNVPTMYWDRFDAWTQNQKELSGVPYKIAVEEKDIPSFFKLTVKVRPKIVADGLDDNAFDVTDTGAYLTAKEINDYIDDPEAIVVDMRNSYESEVGHFEGAITPDVETFRDELKKIPELLTVHKNKKIALYCTGGIRCEKASAWLKHNSFSSVRHLKGGIIDYAHQVKQYGLPNKFKGKNFVFDERMGERIGEEVISTCHLCQKNKSDTHYHCQNKVCHILFIGCGECVDKKAGYCSLWCWTFDALPLKIKKFFIKNNYKHKPAQFKKHRLRPKTE